MRLSTSDVFLLTALAKMGSTLITYPLLLIKSRLQVCALAHTAMLGPAWLKLGGRGKHLGALYCGAGSTLNTANLSAVPTAFCHLFISLLLTFNHLLLLDVSCAQAMNKQTDCDAQYLGVADAVARILRAEGFRGFFKGIQVCFLFSAFGISKV